MPTTDRQTRFLEPDNTEKQYFTVSLRRFLVETLKNISELLCKDGYHVDITSDATHQKLLYPDTLGIWYPGYYEKWFFDRMSYKGTY